MYPITPATSASHYLSDVFEKVGGMVHQAEDEIAACAFALGASYAGKCAVTITSGPGYSLKQEGIGLAVMGEIPLVVVNVQRGGPSTGQPTKVEQGDLLTDHVRQPWRRAESGDRALDHRGMLLFASSPPARSPRPSAWWWWCCPTPRSPPRSSRSRARSSTRPGWPPPADQSRVAAGARPYDWDAGDRPGAPLHPRPARRHAHAHRPRARPREPRRLRPRDQPGKHPRAQPEAGHVAEDAAPAAGARRRRAAICW